MVKQSMSRIEMEGLLAQVPAGRLATCNRDKPYVVPICFLHVGDKIYFHSAPQGKKIENMKANPHVCFQADDYRLVPKPRPCEFTMHYRSVVIFGKARLLIDPEEKMKVLKAMMDKYDTIHSAEPIDEAMVERVTVGEIIIEEMDGKKNV